MRTVRLIYRNQEGRAIALRVPVPIAPALLRLLERALAKRGYVRDE